METNSIVIFLIVLASMIFVLAIQKPLARWEASIPWLVPLDLSVAMESIALAHPLRYALLVFLSWLGVCALGAEVGFGFTAMVQYGVGALVAVFALYTARVSGHSRAA